MDIMSANSATLKMAAKKPAKIPAEKVANSGV